MRSSSLATLSDSRSTMRAGTSATGATAPARRLMAPPATVHPLARAYSMTSSSRSNSSSARAEAKGNVVYAASAQAADSTRTVSTSSARNVAAAGCALIERISAPTRLNRPSRMHRSSSITRATSSVASTAGRSTSRSLWNASYALRTRRSRKCRLVMSGSSSDAGMASAWSV
eukprot:Amastigsp_a677083_105.p3 type:complete len:173 gc:universal Amastigsp_a677083_105:51-569(+)